MVTRESSEKQAGLVDGLLKLRRAEGGFDFCFPFREAKISSPSTRPACLSFDSRVSTPLNFQIRRAACLTKEPQ